MSLHSCTFIHDCTVPLAMCTGVNQNVYCNVLCRYTYQFYFMILLQTWGGGGREGRGRGANLYQTNFNELYCTCIYVHVHIAYPSAEQAPCMSRVYTHIIHTLLHVHVHAHAHAGSLISLLQLNYIYILGFLCVAVLCILPLVAFPVIVSTVDLS